MTQCKHRKTEDVYHKKQEFNRQQQEKEEAKQTEEQQQNQAMQLMNCNMLESKQQESLQHSNEQQHQTFELESSSKGNALGLSDNNCTRSEIDGDTEMIDDMSDHDLCPLLDFSVSSSGPGLAETETADSEIEGLCPTANVMSLKDLSNDVSRLSNSSIALCGSASSGSPSSNEIRSIETPSKASTAQDTTTMEHTDEGAKEDDMNTSDTEYVSDSPDDDYELNGIISDGSDGSEELPYAKTCQTASDECRCNIRHIDEDRLLRDKKTPAIFVVQPILSRCNNTKEKKSNRVQDNMSCCLICGQLKSNFRKHIMTHRKNHKVQAIANCKDPMLKRKLMSQLRLKGNHIHNLKVLKQKKGEFLVGRVPKQSFNLEKWFPCFYCFEWMTGNYSRHIKNCPANAQRSGIVPLITKSILLEGPVVGASEELKSKVLCTMRVDEIMKTALNDMVIVNLANKWHLKNINNELHGKHYVSSHIRLCGRILLELRKVTKSTADMYTYLTSQYFDSLCTVAQNLSKGTGSDDNSAPSNAIKICYEIKHLISIKVGMIIRNMNENEKERKTVNDLLYLLDNEWPTIVNIKAQKAIREKANRNSKELPSPEDVQKLVNYVIYKLKELEKINTESITQDDYSEIRRYALVRTLLFNKRRAGEHQQLTVDAYKERSTQLSDLEKEIAKTLKTSDTELGQDVMKTRGKNNKILPVIIPKECRSAMSILSNEKIRTEMGIKKHNKYLFANSGGTAVCPYSCIRSVCTEVGIDSSTINSTNIRKYVATYVQMLGLQDHQVQQLCKHLGHTLKVHDLYYRQCSGIIERTNITKMMLVIENNLCSKFAGRDIEDIEMSEILAEIQTVNDQDSDDEQLKEQNDEQVDAADAQMDMSQHMRVGGKHRVRWTEKEENEVKELFKLFIIKKYVPNKKDVLNAKKISKNKDGSIYEKDWKTIKYKVYNLIQKQNPK